MGKIYDFFKQRDVQWAIILLILCGLFYWVYQHDISALREAYDQCQATQVIQVNITKVVRPAFDMSDINLSALK